VAAGVVESELRCGGYAALPPDEIASRAGPYLMLFPSLVTRSRYLAQRVDEKVRAMPFSINSDVHNPVRQLKFLVNGQCREPMNGMRCR
jgi:hypothetical protein